MSVFAFEIIQGGFSRRQNGRKLKTTDKVHVTVVLGRRL